VIVEARDQPDRRLGHRAVRRWLTGILVWLVGVAGSGPAEAAGPLVFFGGRLRVGGHVSGTLSPEDDGYFNFAGHDDYGDNALRRFRLALNAELRLAEQAAVLTEVWSDNLRTPRVYALFLRLRPWTARSFDVQLGMVPPVFGAFARRRYGWENPLPGLPLAYHYTTTLREDAIPASAEELLGKRGRGWQVRYSVGSEYPRFGVPLLNAELWDTGVQVRLGRRPVSLAVSVTQGTLSRPRVGDDNGGKQVAGRLAWTPGPELTLGISAARGEFLAREVSEILPLEAGRGFDQRAVGVDLEYARGYWILRAEALWSRWTLPPFEETRIETPQDAVGAYVEARYKLAPGLYVAGRAGGLRFRNLAAETGPQTWDANVTRIELGGGYAPHRHVLLKAAWQQNWRDGRYMRREGLLVAQALLWF
jgi:hypothetical protein